ncbi:MAG: gliding motility-associated C-terminal domain-containing protein, partial [Flavobacteriia bacterium]|nr:gliding motility-associated C-terminal domain-containing protein [Flavobacteriia bacterium]
TPDAGGTWGGGLVNGMFDPAVNAAGTYTYTVTATPPCVDATALVVVTVEMPNNPGISAVDTVCTGDAPFDLFTRLGGNPDPGGSWTGPEGPIAGTFDPASSPQGTYTYLLTGLACGDASATVQMTVLPGPNAGQDNAVALCNTGPLVNLAGLLAGTPDQGGTWTAPDSSVMPSGIINPATASSGQYTYTVAGNASCPDASATVSISINLAPDAGTNGSLAACSSDDPVALFGLLGGSPDQGGTWTMQPVGTPFNGTLDPASDPSGSYVYTVAGLAPCPSASAQVTVTVTQAPDAGNDSTLALCSTDAPVNMFNLLAGTPDAGGSWTDSGGNGTSAIFNPAQSLPGTYRYVIQAIGPCPQDVAQLDISVSQAAFAGVGGDTTLCASGDPFPLATLLGGAFDAGGTWSGPGGMGSDGWVHPDTATSGSYSYTVTAPAPCPAAIAVVQVEIIPLPQAQPSFVMDNGCAPVGVTFISGYDGPGACHWDFGNGMDTTACGPVTIVYDQPGNYTVHFTADPGNGCATMFQTEVVQVVVKPTAAFNMVGPVASTHNPTVAFGNQSSGATGYAWDFGGQGTSTAVTPQFTFPYDVEGIYPICLIAYASPTCADTACADLLIPASASVFVPNAFTPDGDGKNDDFAPIVGGLDPGDYHFYIFDRWGQLVFSTDDIKAGWDGKKDGHDAPQDVYVWKLVGQDVIAKTRLERTGHVTLVR